MRYSTSRVGGCTTLAWRQKITKFQRSRQVHLNEILYATLRIRVDGDETPYRYLSKTNRASRKSCRVAAEGANRAKIMQIADTFRCLMTDRSVFERHAQHYDAWFERNAHAYASEIKAPRTFVPHAGAALEVGVGTGRFAVPLGITVGVELTRAMAVIARKRGITVYEASAEELPFDNESFDFVVMVTTLCFLDDPVQALREAKRVLIPGGRIVIGMIDRETPLGNAYERRKHKSVFYRYAHFHSVTEVMAWLQTVGFSAIRTCQTLFAFPEEMTAVDPVKKGHGQGGFAVITGSREGKT